MTADSVDTLVEIGVVGRPHGIGGDIRIYLHNASSSILENVNSAYLVTTQGHRRCELVAVRRVKDYYLARISGISSRTEAEQIKGAKLSLPRSAMPEVAPGEFYVADLIGLEAWEGDTLLGRVSYSRRQGDIEVATVTGDAEAFEVPLVEDFVVRIDFDKGRILLYDTDLLPRFSVRKRRPRRF